MEKLTISVALIACTLLGYGQSHNENDKKMNPIKIDQVYTVFVTKKLTETVAFYEQYFGFTKLFESTFFVLMQTPGAPSFNIAFMDEEHPTAPPTPKAFLGDGTFLTLEVADAQKLHQQLKERGLKITYPLKDEAWGQRRFGVLDPNNLWVDVVEQIQQQEGFWDQYMKQ